MSYQSALRAFEIRRWTLVKRYLAEELAQNPENTDAFSLWAATDLNTGETANAIEHARAAIGIDPNKHYAFYILGLALMRDKQVFEAEIALEEALAMQPDNPTYLTALASFLPLKSKKALELLDRALAEDPGNISALHQRYERLFRANRKAEAEVVRRQVLQLNPEDARMHEESGWNALADRDGHAKAVDHFREALRLNPNVQRSVVGLQQAQYQLRNPLARILKKASWSKVMLLLAIPFCLSLAYGIVGQGVLHVKVPDTVLAIFFFGSVVFMVLWTLLRGLSASIYYVQLLFDRKKRESLSARIKSRISFGWRTIIGFAAGGLIVIIDILCQSGKLHLPLPHWLYEDWLHIFPPVWRGLAVMAPLAFVMTIYFLVVSLVRLIRTHVRKEPKSTKYFHSLLISSACTAILILYALVAVLRPSEWFVAIIVTVELAIILVPAMPAYRNYVKKTIRAESDRASSS